MQTNLLVKHVSTITRLVIFCRGKKEILMKVYFDDVDDDEKNRIKRKAGQKKIVSTKGKKKSLRHALGRSRSHAEHSALHSGLTLSHSLLLRLPITLVTLTSSSPGTPTTSTTSTAVNLPLTLTLTLLATGPLPLGLRSIVLLLSGLEIQSTVGEFSAAFTTLLDRQGVLDGLSGRLDSSKLDKGTGLALDDFGGLYLTESRSNLGKLCIGKEFGSALRVRRPVRELYGSQFFLIVIIRRKCPP